MRETEDLGWPSFGIGKLRMRSWNGGHHSPDQHHRGKRNRATIHSCSWGALGLNIDHEERGVEGEGGRAMG